MPACTSLLSSSERPSNPNPAPASPPLHAAAAAAADAKAPLEERLAAFVRAERLPAYLEFKQENLLPIHNSGIKKKASLPLRNPY